MAQQAKKYIEGDKFIKQGANSTQYFTITYVHDFGYRGDWKTTKSRKPKKKFFLNKN